MVILRYIENVIFEFLGCYYTLIIVKSTIKNMINIKRIEVYIFFGICNGLKINFL